MTKPELTGEYGGVPITIDDPMSILDGKPTPDAARRHEAIAGRLDQIRRLAASKRLSLYNEIWRDEDHGVLDAAEFARRLVPPPLTVHEEGGTLVYFEDVVSSATWSEFATSSPRSPSLSSRASPQPRGPATLPPRPDRRPPRGSPSGRCGGSSRPTRETSPRWPTRSSRGVTRSHKLSS
jgi:hypothetical protein